jgi:PPOX class probable F420-dependent enzyme
VLDTTTDTGARADRRLREERIAWQTTVRSDGQPQSEPVWFTWDGEGFQIYSQPDRQKLKNIGRNPRVRLHLSSNDLGGDVAGVECTAEIRDGSPLATEIPEYFEKYREGIARIGFDPEGFARSYSVVLRVTPERWQLW